MFSSNVRVGPYAGVVFDERLEIQVDALPEPRKFRVIAYAAYSPGGWVAPEQNGVALIDLDVGDATGGRLNPNITDSLHCQGSGFVERALAAAGKRQFDAWKAMSSGEFEADVLRTPHCRWPGGFLFGFRRVAGETPLWVPRGTKIPKTSLTTILNTLRSEETLGYNDGAKNLFLDRGMLFWRAVCDAIPIKRSDARISVNRGGVAVSGEVYFEIPGFYAYLSESFMRPGITLLYREGGREGANQYHDIPRNKMEFDRFVELVKRIHNSHGAPA